MRYSWERRRSIATGRVTCRSKGHVNSCRPVIAGKLHLERRLISRSRAAAAAAAVWRIDTRRSSRTDRLAVREINLSYSLSLPCARINRKGYLSGKTVRTNCSIGQIVQEGVQNVHIINACRFKRLVAKSRSHYRLRAETHGCTCARCNF